MIKKIALLILIIFIYLGLQIIFSDDEKIMENDIKNNIKEQKKDLDYILKIKK